MIAGVCKGVQGEKLAPRRRAARRAALPGLVGTVCRRRGLCSFDGSARTLRMRTSRSAVLRTCSSSSDSLNFLMATIWPVSLCRALRTTPYVLKTRNAAHISTGAHEHLCMRRPARKAGRAAERAARTPLQWCQESHSFPWLVEEPREPRRGAGCDGSTRHDASRGSTAAFNSLLCALPLRRKVTPVGLRKFDKRKPSELKSTKSQVARKGRCSHERAVELLCMPDAT